MLQRIAEMITGKPLPPKLGGVPGAPNRHEEIKDALFKNMAPGLEETARQISTRLGINLSSTRSGLRALYRSEAVLRGKRTRKGYLWQGKQSSILSLVD